MNDKFDQIVDGAIEAEKREALRQFRLSPIALSRNQAGRTFGRSSGFRPAQRWLWAVGSTVLFLIFSVVLRLRYKGQPSTAGVTKQTIEQVLLYVRETQTQPVLPGVLSLDSPSRDSDMTWNIQSVISLLQRKQYSEADLSDAVFRTLSGRERAFPTAVSLDEKVARGLDLRIRKLSSSRAVAHVLAKYSRKR
jgi:hypothetical protein